MLHSGFVESLFIREYQGNVRSRVAARLAALS